MRTSAIPLALALLMLGQPSAADSDDPFIPPSCPRAADHDKGQALAKAIRDAMAEAERTPMALRGQLELWRRRAEQTAQAVSCLPCDHPAFSAKELADARALEAKASTWAQAELPRFDAEQTLRANVVLPLCNAIWDAENQERVLAQERSNPSGVVDLEVLHNAGRALREDRQKIAALKPSYAKGRGHAFVKWQDEGACREEAKARASQ